LEKSIKKGRIMDVHIEEIASTVRLVNGPALLAPSTMAEILRAVMKAIEEREQHKSRVDAERRVTGGVADEMEGRS
jgi:hypothetical protein